MECHWPFIFPLLPLSSVCSSNNIIFQSCPWIFCDSVSDNFVSHVPLLYKIGKGCWNIKLIVGEFCSLLFLSSATHRVLLSVAEVILMWCGTEEHEENRWARSVYCIFPAPPKDPCNGSIHCCIWKFYFHMEVDPNWGGGKADSTLQTVWKFFTVLERKGTIWGKLQLWTFLSASRDHNLFQLAEIMFCYCLLAGKWMRRCWTEGWNTPCQETKRVTVKEPFLC